MLEDDTKFDRLVDGELTTDEYREMLTTLDEEPGGWRRCAMAFLEAQAWTWEIQQERKQAEVTRTSPSERKSVELPAQPVIAEQAMTVNKSSPISVVRSMKRRAGGHSWSMDLVRIAAIMIFSLGLGMWIQDFRKGQPATGPFIVGTGPAVKSPAVPASVPRTIYPVGKPVQVNPLLLELPVPEVIQKDGRDFDHDERRGNPFSGHIALDDRIVLSSTRRNLMPGAAAAGHLIQQDPVGIDV